MHLFEPQLKQKHAEWRNLSLKKKLARCIQSALKVKHVMFNGQNRLLLDNPVPVCTMFNGLYYCAALAR
jgi:hypothetical protein